MCEVQPFKIASEPLRIFAECSSGRDFIKNVLWSIQLNQPSGQMASRVIESAISSGRYNMKSKFRTRCSTGKVQLDLIAVNRWALGMKKSTLSILVLSLCWLALPALADEQAGGEAAPANAAAPEASASGSSETAEKKTVLQGGVRGSAVKLEEGLALIEQSAKMVQAPALEIAKECTRKETAVARGPNYIGNGIVIPAIGNPNGTFQIGELPARKDRVESFLSAE